METYISNNPVMKKETVMAYAGAVLLAIAFIFKNEIAKDSSPFALFILCIAGLLAAGKYRLAGGTLLFFCGLALAIHPFMFTSSLWLLPGAILVSLAGFIYLINWWKENGQSEKND
jgi:hypothetical protein